MINVDLNDEKLKMKFEGDKITLVSEILIAITKVLYDSPDSITYLIGVLNVIEVNIKIGMNVDDIVDKLVDLYVNRSE